MREVSGQAPGTTDVLLPYIELELRARQVAAALARAGVRRGQRLAFCIPSAQEALPLLFGALEAGIAIVPCEPPLTASELEGFDARLNLTLCSTGASAVVLSDKLRRLLRDSWAPPAGCKVIAPDTLRTATTEWREPITNDEVALVLPTGTSMSQPPALISHGELRERLSELSSALEIDADDVLVSWLPAFHAEGLTAVLLARHCGASLALLPTAAFLKRPVSWLETIHRVRGTVAFASEDGYAFCLAGIGERDLDALDLSSWRLAGAVATSISPITAARFAAKLVRTSFDLAALARAGRPLPDLAAATGSALSHSQEALWFITQLAPDNVAYNVGLCLRIRSDFDRAALRSALAAIYRRHPALRTVFSARSGVPRRHQLGSETLELVSIAAHDLDDSALEQRMLAELERPFDLAVGPLFAARLFERTASDATLLLIGHHIVIDMLSYVVIMAELAEAYAAFARKQTRELGTDDAFDDFVRRQRTTLAGPRGKRLRQYWADQLAGAPHVLSLPTDRPRPQQQTYGGASLPVRLDDGLAAELRALASQHHTTTFAALLGVFQALLHRYAGQNDLLVASPVSGRDDAAAAQGVGYFVNTVPLRARFEPNTTFSELLDQLRVTVSSALDHQDLPFSLIVEQAQVARDLSRSPLCQVIFALQNPQAGEHTSELMKAVVAGGEASLGDLRVEVFELPRRIAQFDLRLNLLDAGSGISGFLEYNTDLFEP
ncbi:MAG TPA: condensation domain-containing protein, partial [Polyangiales bacterium]|nr:condensation domain-containing protein [Polyangiales bacterium]